LYSNGGGGDWVEKNEIVFLILVAMEEGCVVKEPVLRGRNEAIQLSFQTFKLQYLVLVVGG
jgi:hypothetical protein